jgi:hypothetical protein
MKMSGYQTSHSTSEATPMRCFQAALSRSISRCGAIVRATSWWREGEAARFGFATTIRQATGPESSLIEWRSLRSPIQAQLDVSCAPRNSYRQCSISGSSGTSNWKRRARRDLSHALLRSQAQGGGSHGPLRSNGIERAILATRCVVRPWDRRWRHAQRESRMPGARPRRAKT